jgi:hypothetical protein
VGVEAGWVYSLCVCRVLETLAVEDSSVFTLLLLVLCLPKALLTSRSGGTV